MNPFYMAIFCLLATLQVAKSLDILLDFNTQLKMTKTINQVKTKTISSQQQVFIFYSDNSIARYSNTLTLLSSFSIQGLSSQTFNVTLDTFDVYNGSTSFYYGIISGKREILTIQMQNTSKVKKIQGFDQLKNVEILKISASGEPEFLIFDNNKIWKQSAGVKGNITTIPDTMGQTNTILKVLGVQKNGTKYYVIITVFSEIYYLNVSLQNSTYQISSLKLVRKLGQIIMACQVDRGENIWIQFVDGSLLAFSFLTNVTKTIDVNIYSNITTQVMRRFYPQILVDGERILLFDSKAIKINLTLNSYTFVQDVQYFNITNWTGFVALNSSSSFVYTRGSDIIYGFSLSSTQIDSPSLCELSDLCVVANCLIGSGNGTTCLECESGFALLKQICYPLRTCDDVPNCRVCHFFQNYSCFQCQANYTLNPINGSCDFVYLPPPYPTNQMLLPNQGNSTNQTSQANHTSSNPLTKSLNQTNSPNLTQNSTSISNKTDSTIFDQKQLLKNAIPKELPSGFQLFLQNFGKAASKINGFPGSRIILSFLAPLFGLMDDYWYYLYHEDQYEQIKYMPSFLAYMFIISKDRIIMDELIFSSPFIAVSDDFFKSDFSNFTARTIMQIDENQTFLLKNFTDYYQQIILTLIGFVILKIITMCVKIYFRKFSQKLSKRINKKVSDQNAKVQSENQSQNSSSKSQTSILTKIFQSIDQFITFKNLMFTLIGENLIFLSFTFNSQLKIFFYFHSSDKINLVITVLVGFSILAFTGIIIFPAEKNIQKYSINNKISRNIKNEQKQQKSQLMFLTYFFHIKCILYGFIHGYLIKQPKPQYILLASVKLLMICLIFNKKSLFKKISQRICMIVYFFAGIIIDLMCFMSKNRLIPSKFSDKAIERFTIMDIIQIASLVLIGLSIVFDIVTGIIDSIKSICCSEKRQKAANLSQTLTGCSNDAINKIVQNLQQKILVEDKSVHPKRNPSHILLTKPIFRKKISVLKERIGMIINDKKNFNILQLNQNKQRKSQLANAVDAARSISIRNQLNIQMKKYNNPKNMRISKVKDTFEISYARQMPQIQQILEQQSAKSTQMAKYEPIFGNIIDLYKKKRKQQK